MLYVLNIVLTYKINWERIFKQFQNWSIYRKDCFFLGFSKEFQKEPPEVFYKKKFVLKISKYSQEKTYFGVFLNKVAGLKACDFIKSGSNTDVFLWILQNL